MDEIAVVFGRISGLAHAAWACGWLNYPTEALSRIQLIWSDFTRRCNIGAGNAITFAYQARSYATAAQDFIGHFKTGTVDLAIVLVRCLNWAFQVVVQIALWFCRSPGWVSEKSNQMLLGIKHLLHLGWVVISTSFKICAVAVICCIAWRVILRAVMQYALLELDHRRRQQQHEQWQRTFAENERRAQEERARRSLERFWRELEQEWQRREHVRVEQARREKAEQERRARESCEWSRKAYDDQIKAERRRAYENWRMACDQLFKCPAIAKSIPQPPSWPCKEPCCAAKDRVLEACQHNLRDLFYSASEILLALRFEQTRWSPNARRIAELQNAGISNAVAFANEISGVINMMVDERRG